MFQLVSMFQIQVDFNKTEYGGADATNLLVLPSKKRNTHIVAEKKEKTRFLSKAQRKRLEKIVDKKKKKENVSSTLNIFIFCIIPHTSIFNDHILNED